MISSRKSQFGAEVPVYLQGICSKTSSGCLQTYIALNHIYWMSSHTDDP